MIERFALFGVAAAHGLKGELKCVSLGGTQAALSLPVRCYAENRMACDLVSVKPFGQYTLIRIDGIETREQAEAMKGQTLYIDRELVLPPAAGTWFLADLLDLAVYDEATGELLGTVRGINYGTAQDQLVIKKDGQADLYLPAVSAFLLDVDTAAGRLIVRLPDGLLELFRGSRS